MHTGEEAGVTARLRHIRIFIQMYTHIRAHTCTQVKRLVSQLDFQTIDPMQDFTMGEVSHFLKKIFFIKKYFLSKKKRRRYTEVCPTNNRCHAGLHLDRGKKYFY
jgi:hypothetical protein